MSLSSFLSQTSKRRVKMRREEDEIKNYYRMSICCSTNPFRFHTFHKKFFCSALAPPSLSFFLNSLCYKEKFTHKNFFLLYFLTLYLIPLQNKLQKQWDITTYGWELLTLWVIFLDCLSSPFLCFCWQCLDFDLSKFTRSWLHICGWGC